MEQGGRGGEEGGVCGVCVRHETLWCQSFGISVLSWIEAGNFRVDGISMQPCFYFIKQSIEKKVFENLFGMDVAARHKKCVIACSCRKENACNMLILFVFQSYSKSGIR